MLKRKHARLCLILLGVSVLNIVGFWLSEYVLKVDSLFWGIFWVCSTSVFLIATIIAEVLLLRCKNCGKTVTRPRWNPGAILYCPLCGKPFIFDDDPGDEKRDGM